MIPLRDHPAVVEMKRRHERARRGEIKWWNIPRDDIFNLNVRLTHLLSLDKSAVYIERAGSTIVYYVSPHRRDQRPGTCGRIVLAPNGGTRQIDTVGFDPRGAAVREPRVTTAVTAADDVPGREVPARTLARENACQQYRGLGDPSGGFDQGM